MYQRILVPFDGSPTSRRGLDEALRLAKLCGGSVRLVHVIDELKYVTGFETFAAYNADLLPLMQEAGEQILQAGRDAAVAARVEVETLLFTSAVGRVCDIVVEQARTWKADLIVLGTHGRRGVGRWLLGSDAEQILRLAPVPVLLVRAPVEEEKSNASEAAKATAVEHVAAGA
ncbi:MAG: universal stress protein [Gammaproteobacteria bacterium]|nr:universal stress protein [Gammaproteobacteria bacterium]MBU1442167.1 universal stress protein [Gammaproteobacteria bacterium]MBU2407853.1 universal stress protein [Gammaproteobacteria bacterium]